jgi:hypothetical protein
MMLTDEQIKDILLANGFTIKEGQTDLKPYVYQAARALLGAAAVNAAGNTGLQIIPVLRDFDLTQPIGALRILKSAIPDTPDFVFSIGYKAQPFELLTVSLLSDAKYLAYLKQRE